ncbi:hypothetical protein N0V95_010043, partial [Ascochyta clinopodiicola]
MSPPNTAPQPAASQDQPHEDALKDAQGGQDVHEEKRERVETPVEAVVEKSEQPEEKTLQAHGGDEAGQAADGREAGLVDDGIASESVEPVERAPDSAAAAAKNKEESKPEERSAAELIEQLTAKTQEMALESASTSTSTPLESTSTSIPPESSSDPPRAHTPTPTPTDKAAGKAAVRSPSPPPPPPKDDKYLVTSNGPSRSTSPLSPHPHHEKSARTSEDAAAADYTAKLDGADHVAHDD